MNMTVDQIRERKVRVESEMLTLLSSFIADTGVDIERLEIDTFSQYDMGRRRPKNLLVGVFIKTESI